MVSFVNLVSKKKGEINRFLSKFYNTEVDLYDHLSWEKEYQNPVEISDIIGVFVDNLEDYSLNLFVCIDKNVFINITTLNANYIIKYLYERFPY